MIASSPSRIWPQQLLQIPPSGRLATTEADEGRRILGSAVTSRRGIRRPKADSDQRGDLCPEHDILNPSTTVCKLLIANSNRGRDVVPETLQAEEPFTGASGQGGGVTEICFHLVRKNTRRGLSRLLENEGTRQTATPVLLKNCLPEGLWWHCKLALSRSNGCGAQAGSSTKAAESFVPNRYDATECCQRVL